MSIDWTAMKVIADVVQWLVVAVIGSYVWWTRRWTANAEALNLLDGRIDGNARRLDAVERELRNKPGHKDLERIRSELSALRSEVREIAGSLRGLSRTFDTVVESLINRSNKE